MIEDEGSRSEAACRAGAVSIKSMFTLFELSVFLAQVLLTVENNGN